MVLDKERTPVHCIRWLPPAVGTAAQENRPGICGQPLWILNPLIRRPPTTIAGSWFGASIVPGLRPEVTMASGYRESEILYSASDVSKTPVLKLSVADDMGRRLSSRSYWQVVGALLSSLIARSGQWEHPTSLSLRHEKRGGIFHIRCDDRQQNNRRQRIPAKCQP